MKLSAPIFLLISASLLLLGSCRKCEECTETTIVEYSFSGTSSLPLDQFINYFPTSTTAKDLGELCGKDLKEVNDVTTSNTGTLSFLGETITTTTTIITRCE